MPIALTPLLEVSDLTVRFPSEKGSVSVLDGISMAVGEGEIVDVVGPSGSGKSTLLRAIARLMPDATGTVQLRGAPSTGMAPERWRAAVAMLPQRPALVDGTLAENLLLPWRFKVRSGQSMPSQSSLRDALDEVGLGEVSLDREAVRLSVGQQARVVFARVLLTSPEVLLLDEAEAALDDASALAISEAVERFSSGCGRISGRSAGVVRVRHRGSDGLASRRFSLVAGHLQEVPT